MVHARVILAVLLVRTSPGRLLTFVLGAALSLAVATGAGGVILGMAGRLSQMAAMALTSGLLSAALLLVSAGLLSVESTSLRSLGLPLTPPRARQFAAGFSISALLFLAVAWTKSALVRTSWTFEGTPGLAAALTGLALMAVMVLAEELLFRGVGLRYLRALTGDFGAIVISAVLFGLYHLAGSSAAGTEAALLFLMPTLGGLLFAWAAVRSDGLALPLGLHLGGNWVQTSIAGFSTTPEMPVQALWRIPIGISDASWLFGPDLVPRLPYVAAVVVAAALTKLFLSRRDHVARDHRVSRDGPAPGL